MEECGPGSRADARPDSSRPCRDPSHRVIPIRFPYTDAQAIRAKLVSRLGYRVSSLRGRDGQWTVVVCTECAQDDIGGAGGEQAGR
jgi:hypothetical protein